ncbi:MAG: thioredoxin fold domain-containing protein [Methyloglobulus sp.]|nr:thioredoxin fold domain-containing protein [Methyloglobulus sp.]
MGVFSALIIGPCVTAPLAGALLYISQTGDAVLGGAALFSLGLGMGTPLLLVGTFAGKLLPRTGSWMEAVKAVFGIGLLAVAIGLLSRIIPVKATLALWLMLATLPVFLLMRKRRWRIAGFTTIIYGVLLWLGFSGHYTKEIPALVCSAVEACEASLQPTLAFKKVSTVADFQAQLEMAQRQNKPVMLDFYADWCTSCVELKHSTFTDPSVHEALSDTVILQADVTQHTEADKAFLKQFNLIGPPAILFFSPARKELTSFRIIGYVDAKDFLLTVGKAFPL